MVRGDGQRGHPLWQAPVVACPVGAPAVACSARFAAAACTVPCLHHIPYSHPCLSQDARLVIVNVARNGGHAALGLTWAWLQERRQQLLDKLGGTAWCRRGSSTAAAEP